MHGTTILCVRKNGKVVVIGDGQVSLGNTIVKPNAQKVRRINDNVIAGQLTRACVELAKAWRTDKYLRALEALLIVTDNKQSFTLTGNGDVLQPHDGIIGIGSGGTYALAAARALIEEPHLSAEEVARRSMKIAADICIYTNHNFVMEVLDEEAPQKE
ncbi:hypothetical protein LEN26_000055 [Aphanomyces euteiches]|nr:hypothetical protein AeMF1_000335 [Aphanomyces euteiches]KAH9164420.1 hypothetical protein LEN26_000055 [Aphanomyces euteiches]